MKAIRIHQHGGPEVLCYEEAPLREPGPGEVRVRIEAAGVNYLDIYHRRSLCAREFLSFLVSKGRAVDALGEGVMAVSN